MKHLYSEIIIKPLMTEKTSMLQTSDNTYVFKVKKTAGKTIIKEAIEKLFDVKVKNINTVNVSGKPKRVGRFSGKTPSYKKAYVKLQPGEIIGAKPEENISSSKGDKK